MRLRRIRRYAQSSMTFMALNRSQAPQAQMTAAERIRPHQLYASSVYNRFKEQQATGESQRVGLFSRVSSQRRLGIAAERAATDRVHGAASEAAGDRA
jgi:hypothetical protein